MLYFSMSFAVLLRVSTAATMKTTNIAAPIDSIRSNDMAATEKRSIPRVTLNSATSKKNSIFFDGRNFDETQNERDLDDGPTPWPTYAPTPLTKAPTTLIPTYSPTELPTKTPSSSTLSPSNSPSIQSSPPSTIPSSSASQEPSDSPLIPSPTPHPTIQPVINEFSFQATAFPTSVWSKK